MLESWQPAKSVPSQNTGALGATKDDQQPATGAFGLAAYARDSVAGLRNWLALLKFAAANANTVAELAQVRGACPRGRKGGLKPMR